MKRALKWIGIGVGCIALLVAGLVTYIQLTYNVDFPDAPRPAIQASTDAEVIARGEYIANAVAHCSACHMDAESMKARKYDFTKPLVGGYEWNMGPFGRFIAANLTSHETGIGKLSDGDIARTVRHGVGSDGKLSPMMWFTVGPMADEDLTAVISYLRTLQPVEAKRDRTEYGIMLKALSGKFKPKAFEVPPYAAPASTPSLERGRYLAEGPAACFGCHTPVDRMTFDFVGPKFSGAADPEPDHENPEYELSPPNLTPDPKTGHIYSWDEDKFVDRFKNGGRIVPPSIMPWENFSRMTEADLRSIYRFLRSLPPAVNDTGPVYRKVGSFKKT